LLFQTQLPFAFAVQSEPGLTRKNGSGNADVGAAVGDIVDGCDVGGEVGAVGPDTGVCVGMLLGE